jgi:hypothetical protein
MTPASMPWCRKKTLVCCRAGLRCRSGAGLAGGCPGQAGGGCWFVSGTCDKFPDLG